MSLENFKVEDLGVGATADVPAHRFRWWRKADGEAPNGNYVAHAYSEDLQLVLAGIKVNGDLAYGTEYIQLVRGEPGPKLFSVPPTYKIVSMRELPPAN